MPVKKTSSGKKTAKKKKAGVKTKKTAAKKTAPKKAASKPKKKAASKAKTKPKKTTPKKTTPKKTSVKAKTKSTTSVKKTAVKKTSVKTKRITVAKGKYYYFFGNKKADGNGTMKDLLGGKGAGLAEMSRAGIPVPPGMTITTEVCKEYTDLGRDDVYELLREEIENGVGQLEKTMGKKFGDPKNPLLLSVRSGARVSMPGMMDTVLNLGLNEV